MEGLFPFLIVLALAWGALTFGAVYPWGYWPLLAVGALVGAWGLVAPARGRRIDRALALALAVVVGAILLQLVPLPQAALHTVSPAADAFLRQLDLRYAMAGLSDLAAAAPAHPITIDPSATWLAVAFVTALGLFFLGLMRMLSAPQIERLVAGIVVLSVLLALVGMIQKAVSPGTVYGQIVPNSGPYGPFFNHNHFAGWMLMAIPLALGYLFAHARRAMHGVKAHWRHRLIWLSSPDATRLVLSTVAVLLVGLSLVLTSSRSGIAGFAVALLAAGWFVARAEQRTTSRRIAFGYLLLVAAICIGWAGADTVAARFGQLEGSHFGGRLPIWRDTMRIVRDFPLAGTGANTYKTAMFKYQTPNALIYVDEAHNDYLQLLAEGGALLALPAIALGLLLIARFVRGVRNEPADSRLYWIRAGAITGLLAIGLQEIGEFSLQVPGNAALCVVLCAIAARQNTVPRHVSRSS